VSFLLGETLEYTVKKVRTSGKAISYDCQQEGGRDRIEIEFRCEEPMVLSGVMLSENKQEVCMFCQNTTGTAICIFIIDARRGYLE